MNAVVALCHFCEHHGPSVVFCTQAFHSRVALHPDMSSRLVFDYLGRDIPTPLPSPGDAGSTPVSRSSDLCEACRSLKPEQSGFITHDKEAQIRYVSGQHPVMPQLYGLVRHACVRSLSGEVCQGREGPIIFGDNYQGYVFSHTFSLKDRQARGLKRWYSIIVLMMDKVFLINSWAFLVKNCQFLIQDLKHKSKQIYDSEPPDGRQSSDKLESSAGLMSTSIEEFLRGRRGPKQSFRSVTSLTGEGELFRQLHTYFSLLLKYGGSRLVERQLEGPPLGFEALDAHGIGEDEEVEEEEEDGIERLSEQLSNQSQSDDHPSIPASFADLKDLFLALGTKKFCSAAAHVLHGNQLIVRGPVRILVESILRVLQTLLPDGCCQTILFSSEYESSYKCNFLGLDSSVQLPDHLKSSDVYVLIDVTRKQSSGANGRQKDGSSASEITADFTYAVQASRTVDKMPTMLRRLEAVLSNDSISSSVIEQCVISAKAEWMNKVKVLYKYTRSGPISEVDKLLSVLSSEKEDLPLMQFWIRGLGQQYRSQVLCRQRSSNSGSEPSAATAAPPPPPPQEEKAPEGL
ncbi:folliculin-like isoform X2 [Oscarella lobularis]|uniref:folliculin-like isoform X2 n=1 Tax=Oscarella lobularis TaxID=121494 RepID=UPI0033135300